MLKQLMCCGVLAAGMLGSSLAAADVNWSRLNLDVVDRHIVPRYQVLAKTAAKLDSQAREFCAAPDEKKFAALRTAYHQTMDTWMGIQHVRFGSVDMYLRYNRFQIWPDKHNTSAKQLGQTLADKDVSILQEDNFPQASVAIQGLTALERLLFDTDITAASFSDKGKANFRCGLVQAIAHNLAKMSADIVTDWTVGEKAYRNIIIGAEQGNDYFSSSTDVASRLLNNLYTELQSILDQKLLDPLGENARTAKPTRAESWRSRRSLRNVEMNLEAVQELYAMVFAPALQNAPDKVEMDKQLRQAFADAIAAVRDIKQPLYDIAGDDKQRPALNRLLDAVKVLKRQIAALPRAIDIPLGFNSLDGD